MQPYVLQKHLEFPNTRESILSKTTGTTQMWIHSETSEIYFPSFILASTDFAGDISIQNTQAELLKNFYELLPPLHRKMRESLCMRKLSVLPSHGSMMFGIHVLFTFFIKASHETITKL